MTYLSLALLGPFQAWTANGSFHVFRTLKERALLAYLMVENNHIHRREALAEMFWPDRAEGIARNNLRQALFGIRQVIGEEGFNAIFTVTTDDVQVNLSDHIWLDLTAFDIHFNAAQSHRHASDEPCAYCMQHLRDAVEIYRGNFLEGVFLDKNQEVQEWIVFHREQYIRLQIQALEFLIKEYEQMGDDAQAVQYALRQVQLDDLQESRYRRLMGILARLGRSSAALEQYDICRSKLRDSLGTDVDEETSALADKIREGNFDQIQSRIPAVTHNLPDIITPFIGREMELTQIIRHLGNPSCRLISLVGPGGVGKTRLAVQAAQFHLTAFSDGVYFIPLDAVTSTSQITEVIARVLGLAPGVQQDIQGMLLEYLHRKHILLVLDNFEHLMDAKGLLIDILQAAPFVKILVTSRVRLHLQVEFLLELRGLPFPLIQENGSSIAHQDQREGWTQAGQFDAVRLLLERASRVISNGIPLPGVKRIQNTSVLDDRQEMESAVHICQLVEGLPLGIELAASWARDFTFTQIANEVQRNGEFLQTSFQDMPERHRSLRVSFEHSWDLLPENQREVFCKLAVFPGSFSVIAANAVAGAALPWLMQLEDKSLVRRAGFGRYDLHPLIRQFAELKLRQYSRKVVDQAVHQHAQYFCSFLQERELSLKGGRQAEAFNEVEIELHNIRVAWDWAVEHHAQDLVERACGGMMFFLEARSRWQEGAERFSSAVASLQESELNPAVDNLLGYLFAVHAWFCMRLTRFQQAEELLQHSLKFLGEQDADANRAFAHFTLGFLYVWMSRFSEALLHLTTALSTSERIGYDWGIAWSRELLTEIAFESGQLGLREDPFLETLAKFERVGDLRGSTRALNYLGNIAIGQQQYPAARTYFEKLLRISESLGDVWGEASGYTKLGQVAFARGDFEQAWRLHQRSLAMLQKMGDQRRTGHVLSALGEVAFALKKCVESRDYFHQALEIASQTRNTPLAQDILIAIAAVLLQNAEPDCPLGLVKGAVPAEQKSSAHKERAAGLLIIAQLEPIGDRLIATRTRSLMENVQTRLTTDRLEAIRAQMQSQTIWNAVNEMLRAALTPG